MARWEEAVASTNVETGGERQYLVVNWHERRRRLQLRATREGFGHKVLAKTVAQNLNGIVSYEIKPGEVCWMLRAELPNS